MSDESTTPRPLRPVRERQAAEDRQLLRALLVKLLDPSGRLDEDDRSTLALYLDEALD